MYCAYDIAIALDIGIGQSYFYLDLALDERLICMLRCFISCHLQMVLICVLACLFSSYLRQLQADVLLLMC